MAALASPMLGIAALSPTYAARALGLRSSPFDPTRGLPSVVPQGERGRVRRVRLKSFAGYFLLATQEKVTRPPEAGGTLLILLCCSCSDRYTKAESDSKGAGFQLALE